MSSLSRARSVTARAPLEMLSRHETRARALALRRLVARLSVRRCSSRWRRWWQRRWLGERGRNRRFRGRRCDGWRCFERRRRGDGRWRDRWWNAVHVERRRRAGLQVARHRVWWPVGVLLAPLSGRRVWRADVWRLVRPRRRAVHRSRCLLQREVRAGAELDAALVSAGLLRRRRRLHARARVLLTGLQQRPLRRRALQGVGRELHRERRLLRPPL